MENRKLLISFMKWMDEMGNKDDKELSNKEKILRDSIMTLDDLKNESTILETFVDHFLDNIYGKEELEEAEKLEG